jgi:hypothetical protein
MNIRLARNFWAVPTLAGCALALAAVSASAQSVAPAPSASSGPKDDVASGLAGNSFSLAINYAQATFKTTRAGYRSQITDNGGATPALELSSGERVFRSWPMQTGHMLLGWNFKAVASVFETRYQLVDSAVRGENRGTSVRGGFVGLAPTVFFKLGPLYPDSEIFWKVGYGVGPGYLKSSGTALFTGGSVQTVGSSSGELALYQDGFLQLQAGNWQFEISGKTLLQGDAEKTSLETYGFGVAYRLGF